MALPAARSATGAALTARRTLANIVVSRLAMPSMWSPRACGHSGFLDSTSQQHMAFHVERASVSV